MIMRLNKRALALALIGLLAAGCTLELATLADPARPLDRETAASQLAALQTAQAAALDLWDRLIFGEEVPCTEAIPLPPPLSPPPAEVADTPPAAQVAGQLGAAYNALAQSAARWDAECSYPGAIVGLEAARAGRDAALRAGDPLQAAQALLDAWPTQQAN
jgi:hypothetical protein